MNVTNLQAVVFDLDDTLYPERTYALSGFDAVALGCRDMLGDPVASAARMKALFQTGDRRRIFNIMLQEHHQRDEAATVARMIEVYRTHQPNITLYPDAVRILASLRAHYQMGIITDGPAVMQRAKLTALCLNEQVDEIIVTDERGYGFTKPDLGAFQLMAQRLGVAHDVCVYVGDNPAKDFVAPNQLGWLTIQVDRPHGIYRHALAPVAGEPQHVIETLDDLRALLKPQ